MADRPGLTQAYMRAHPAEAARTLDAAPLEPLAALLQETPARTMAPVLAEMSPARAAAALQRLHAERTVELLDGLGVQASIQILRHLPDALQQALLERLPTATALSIRLLLSFPHDSAGAIADPAQVVAMPLASAAEVLQQVRAFDGRVDHVLVLDESKRLQGWVPLDLLLRAPEAAPVGPLASAPPVELPATMPLAAALASPGWLQESVLPVVERSGRLVGLLTRRALEHAAARRPAQVTHESLAATLAQSYLLGVTSLMQAVMSWLPRVPRVGEADRGH